ncbi:hypothetical protein SAMN03097708_02962 [Thiohalomonas denitrificans]|uniref:Uncharacterized protein n=1 Tax=Thiohalomonas denitrificans TaxID=415747 RepID=A0A1G5QXE2_9GAMM|nr:hypothetical protein SAMN03097708_02962 [Thiohalomonas denitrificans]
MGTNDRWSVDPSNQTASHSNGLTVKLSGGEVIDILEMPKAISTRELPALLQEAATIYGQQKASPPPRPATPPPTAGPRKSKLSLGKRK